jgi:hypothetical protein
MRTVTRVYYARLKANTGKAVLKKFMRTGKKGRIIASVI